MTNFVEPGILRVSTLRFCRTLTFAVFCGVVSIAVGAFGCAAEGEVNAPAWRSFLVGVPEIPCVRDSDCPVGICALDGCKAIANTLRYGTRETMVRAMGRLKARCSEPCKAQLDEDLEAIFAEASVSSPLVLIRLADALTLHSDVEKAKVSLRAKMLEATEPETVVSLQLVLARLGDPVARSELSKMFPTGDSITDLLLLSAGVAGQVDAALLCGLHGDPSVPPVLRALALVELCGLGEECSAQGEGVDLRPFGACRNRAKAGLL